MSVKWDLNVATEKISLRMKIRKSSHVLEAKASPRGLVIPDLFLYVCLPLVFLPFAKEFKFYTLIFSFSPQSTLFLQFGHDSL